MRGRRGEGWRDSVKEEPGDGGPVSIQAVIGVCRDGVGMLLIRGPMFSDSYNMFKQYEYSDAVCVETLLAGLHQCF